ncbi:hypothetical protein AGMMS49593_04620 [Endomicrobiia bacterium]|nr:hypothetical protein AGMMS49593_04620 [Endomicrobiia bacterium]
MYNMEINDDRMGASRYLIGENFLCNGVKLYSDWQDETIRIGNDCMFGWDITIFASDFHTLFNKETGIPVNNAKDVVIGDHVWVGYGVVVMKSSKVASNSVIGARAVVAGHFDETNIVLAGNPAAVVKRGINWSRDSHEVYERKRHE